MTSSQPSRTGVASAAGGLSYGPEDGQCLSMPHFGGLRSRRRRSLADRQAELVIGACAARPAPGPAFATRFAAAPATQPGHPTAMSLDVRFSGRTAQTSVRPALFPEHPIPAKVGTRQTCNLFHRRPHPRSPDPGKLRKTSDFGRFDAAVAGPARSEGHRAPAPPWPLDQRTH